MAKQWGKSSSSTPHHNPAVLTLLTLFYRWGNWGSEGLSIPRAVVLTILLCWWRCQKSCMSPSLNWEHMESCGYSLSSRSTNYVPKDSTTGWIKGFYYSPCGRMCLFLWGFFTSAPEPSSLSLFGLEGQGLGILSSQVSWMDGFIQVWCWQPPTSVFPWEGSGIPQVSELLVIFSFSY